MTKKLLVLLSVLLALVCVFAVTTFAADPVTAVYVTASGAGTGDGLSPENAAKSLGTATQKLTADGTVYIVGTYNFSGSRAAYSDSKYNVTITAYDENSVFNYAGNMFVTRNTYDKTLTFDMPITIPEGATWKMFGGFNNITFSENFDVIGGDLEFYGGWTEKSGDAYSVVISPEKPYTITVNGGKFAKFHGGNRRTDDILTSYVGSIITPVTINIGGGTFGKAGDYDVTTNNKSYDAFSVSGMSILADKATLNITGGTFNTPIYIQGALDTITAPVSQAAAAALASDAKYYALDGDVAINITGGTFNGGAISAYYTQAAYTTLMRGNFDVSITGGTFKEGTVIDATQVKAYEGQSKKATLTYTVANVTPKRFDVVNGEAKTYDEPIRIVFIGDSITEGYASDSAKVDRLTEAYSAQFLALCEADTDTREVIVGNFGVSAAGFHPYNSKGRYYNDMLAYPMVWNETDPTYLVLAMGTNDASNAGGTNGALLEFEKNYTAFLTHFGEMESVEKVFVTNAIFRKTSTTVADLRCASVMRPTQEKIAKELAKTSDKYQFVDLYGLTLEAALDDTLWIAKDGNIYERLHPATQGYGIMGEAIYNAVFNGVCAPEEYRLTEIYVSDSGKLYGAGTEDDPIGFLPYALSLAKPGEEVTIYVKGTVTAAANLNLPIGPSKLNVVGYDDEATISVAGASFKLGCPTKLDNVTLKTTASGTHIMASYYDIEITESCATDGAWHFYAGHNAYGDVDPATSASHDNVESLSSDKDVTIKIYAGDYTRFMLGNCRFHSEAPYASYSGNMTGYIGENVSVSDTEKYVGIVGHNYNTGTITVYDLSGENIPQYATQGTQPTTGKHDESNNTGTVTVLYELPADPDAPVQPDVPEEPEAPFDGVIGDVDGDGALEVDDVVSSIAFFGNEIPEEMRPYFGGKTTLTLIDIVTLLVQLVK